MLSVTNLGFQAKRLKFGFKGRPREKLFDKLQEANDRMRNLLESNDRIVAARRQRYTIRSAPRRIGDFWRHAQRLHTALSKAWQCGCLSHVANLGLEHRTSEKVEFDVFFDLTAAGLIFRKVKVIERRDGVDQRTAQRDVLPNPNSQRQVRFQPPAPVPIPDPSQRLTPIQDLCASLASYRADCWGFLEEDEHRFMVYPDTKVPTEMRTPTKTLGDLLESAELLTRRKRYSLALTLASSYLQLGATPWLNTQLHTDNIVFLQDPADPAVTVVDHPYIRRELSRSNIGQSTDGLPTLGIRLLELCFGRSLEATTFRKQLPAGDSISAPILDYAAAIQWSKEAVEEAGPEFAEAIDWCLHAKERIDGSWRNELLQLVVLPLDSCHKQMSQKATSS